MIAPIIPEISLLLSIVNKIYSWSPSTICAFPTVRQKWWHLDGKLGVYSNRVVDNTVLAQVSAPRYRFWQMLDKSFRQFVELLEEHLLGRKTQMKLCLYLSEYGSDTCVTVNNFKVEYRLLRCEFCDMWRKGCFRSHDTIRHELLFFASPYYIEWTNIRWKAHIDRQAFTTNCYVYYVPKSRTDLGRPRERCDLTLENGTIDDVSSPNPGSIAFLSWIGRIECV